MRVPGSAVALAIAGAGWCGAALCGLTPAEAGTVTGTATFRERIALPPGATFEAIIEDASRADAPALVLGRFGPVPAGAPPFAFRIDYDDAAIMPGHRYGVRASVRHEGRLLFTTDRHVPAVAGNKPIAITMVRVKDAPAKPATQATLRNTYWKLVAQNGKPAIVVKGQREPHIVLKADEARVSGSGGCNNIVGGFTLDGNRLKFIGMGSTMMMCPEGMEQERDFLKMLDTVARYRISGEALTLADDKGRAIAKFRAVALR